MVSHIRLKDTSNVFFLRKNLQPKEQAPSVSEIKWKHLKCEGIPFFISGNDRKKSIRLDLKPGKRHSSTELPSPCYSVQEASVIFTELVT